MKTEEIVKKVYFYFLTWITEISRGVTVHIHTRNIKANYLNTFNTFYPNLPGPVLQINQPGMNYDELYSFDFSFYYLH